MGGRATGTRLHAGLHELTRRPVEVGCVRDRVLLRAGRCGDALAERVALVAVLPILLAEGLDADRLALGAALAGGVGASRLALGLALAGAGRHALAEVTVLRPEGLARGVAGPALLLALLGGVALVGLAGRLGGGRGWKRERGEQPDG